MPAFTCMGTPTSMTSQHGQCRNIVGSFLFRVFPLPATPPYAVRPLHMHGAPAYGRYQLGRLTVPARRSYTRVRGTLVATLGRKWRPGVTVPEYGGGLDDQGAKKTAQDADRNGATTRTGSYAQCVLEDMRAQSDGKRNRF